MKRRITRTRRRRWTSNRSKPVSTGEDKAAQVQEEKQQNREKRGGRAEGHREGHEKYKRMKVWNQVVVCIRGFRGYNRFCQTIVAPLCLSESGIEQTPIQSFWLAFGCLSFTNFLLMST